jgi:hypothetical protein
MEMHYAERRARGFALSKSQLAARQRLLHWAFALCFVVIAFPIASYKEAKFFFWGGRGFHARGPLRVSEARSESTGTFK